LAAGLLALGGGNDRGGWPAAARARQGPHAERGYMVLSTISSTTILIYTLTSNNINQRKY